MEIINTLINGKMCTVSRISNSGGFVRVEYGDKKIELNPIDFGAIKAKCATLLLEPGRDIEYAVTDPSAMGDFLFAERKRSAARYYEEQRQNIY